MQSLSSLSNLCSSSFYRNSDSCVGYGSANLDIGREVVNYHVDELLKLAKDCGASDIRIKAGSVPKFTINSTNVASYEKGLEESRDPLSSHQAQELIYQMISDKHQVRLENTGDVDLSYSVRLESGVLQNYRVNVFKEKNGLGAVIRVLEPVAPNIEDLFAHDTRAVSMIQNDRSTGPKDATKTLHPVINTFETLFKRKEGLILVTGPTGSGKSTTIAAMIQHHLDTKGGSLVTLEQPIEFYFQERANHTSVIQREVGRDTETFETGLRAALREAPNLLLVGEMRDKESVEGALQAAQTGHLVVATLHTNSAKETIYRIINAVGSENKENVQSQLSISLVAIVSQKLPTRATPLTTGPLYARKRIAVPEILTLTPAIANLIRQGKIEQIDNMLQTSGAEGMRTVNQSLDLYVKAGFLTMKEADLYRRAN